MTEEQARAAVEQIVGANGISRLERLAALVIEENSHQNLIAASTVPFMWARHIWDSIQLLRWLPDRGGIWLDIGTGGGFPGLAIACVNDGCTVLVEPRRRRAEFLAAAATSLGLNHVKIEHKKIERVVGQADVISARAVAPIENLLRLARHCATPQTRWLLPRGIVAENELSTLRERWAGSFHVEQSLSDDRGSIVIAEGVSLR